MLKTIRLSGGIFALTLSLAALAEKPIIYPAKNQNAAQQQKDEGECNTWATGNTGVDPAVLASTPPVAAPAPAGGGGERARGAVKGAAVGAIIDGGDGAAKGAAVGVVAGGSKSRQKQRAAAQGAQQQQQAQAQSQQQQMATYYKAFGACLEGRGYTVK